jgi:cell division protease FtsH
MGAALSVVGWILLGTCLGAGGVAVAVRRKQQSATASAQIPVVDMVRSHFHPVPLGNITISERKFPFRVRADLQRAIDRLFSSETKILHFCGIRKEYAHEGVGLSDCTVSSQHNPAVLVPPQYEDVDIGDAEPIRCLKTGFWFLEENGNRFVVLLAPAGQYGQVTGIQFQIGVTNSAEGTKITQRFFKHLEDSVLRAESYRGKILSLEQAVHSYSGEASGITVHTLRTVERNQVILPRKTLDLPDVENALEEMLFSGGSLNLKLLGAEMADGCATVK